MDGCAQDADCGNADFVCVPRGAYAHRYAVCARVACRTDADCGARAGGVCSPFFTRCRSDGFFCRYPDDPCTTDQDCQGNEPMSCVPNANGQGTQCVVDLPAP